MGGVLGPSPPAPLPSPPDPRERGDARSSRICSPSPGWGRGGPGVRVYSPEEDDALLSDLLSLFDSDLDSVFVSLFDSDALPVSFPLSLPFPA